MDKTHLLAELEHHWQRLVSAVDGVPDETLETTELPNGYTIKAICCLLTAWDGEMLRRIGVARGERKQSHDPHDAEHWLAWEKQQIAIKSVMPMRGVMVDMIGTRRRLLAQIEALDNETVARWLTSDPRANSTAFEDYVRQIEVWRERWNTEHPTGWRRFFRKK